MGHNLVIICSFKLEISIISGVKESFQDHRKIRQVPLFRAVSIFDVCLVTICDYYVKLKESDLLLVEVVLVHMVEMLQEMQTLEVEVVVDTLTEV